MMKLYVFDIQDGMHTDYAWNFKKTGIVHIYVYLVIDTISLSI